MVAGMFQPTDGQVIYDGTAIDSLNRRVGYMTQKDTLLPWRTVADNIAAPLELACRSTDKAERAEKVRQMIELVVCRVSKSL
jgi:NitT/TauT family transport system ATP-binding protein